MTPSQIEKEILIDAPIDVVWGVVTQPDQMDRWLSDKADFELAPGGTGSIRMTARTTYNVRVEAIEPHKRFAFRWAHPDGETPDDKNSTLVEFILEPEGEGTRLRVVESGFDTVDWPEDTKSSFFNGHENGWPGLIRRARDLVEGKK